MKKILIWGIVLSLMVVFCGKETSEVEKKVEEKAELQIILPSYGILNEDIYDAPIKTQVTLSILVSGKISEEGLKVLLGKLYSSIKARKGFKYHKHPTNIYIYAYTSKERFQSEMGLWIAMLDKSYDDAEPNIRVKRTQLDQLGKEPEQKFGLSEAKRKKIYWELDEAGWRAEREGQKKYPSDLNKQGRLCKTLKEKYKAPIRKKYNITKDQAFEIRVEGLVKDWPVP